MKGFVQRFSLAHGLRYGRSPAEQILSDSREMSLALERFSAIGAIPRGTTVWRHSRGDWRTLPNPEKTR